jgi:hypothetical protein
MTFSQVGVFTYGVLYVLLAYAMEVENLRLGYPGIYMAVSIVAQLLVICGIFLFGLGDRLDLARWWQWLFPYLILELVWGIVLDASVPAEYNFFTHGVEWIEGIGLSLCLAAPAYYFNYRVARYQS